MDPTLSFAAPGKSSSYNERAKYWKCVYNELYPLTVPPGRHTISLQNLSTNASWIKVPAIILEDLEPVRPAKPDAKS